MFINIYIYINGFDEAEEHGAEEDSLSVRAGPLSLCGLCRRSQNTGIAGIKINSTGGCIIPARTANHHRLLSMLASVTQ